MIERTDAAPFTPIVWFEQLRRDDVARVGGKNASLGEMVATLAGEGVNVPPGFATTADAYWRFIDENGLRATIDEAIANLAAGKRSLAETGETIRRAILTGEWPVPVADAIRDAYRQLCRRTSGGGTQADVEIDVAVRSSATAEDLPDASFAGQQETYLNVRGERALIAACRRCYASLFTDRAISYREAKGFDHTKVALSIGVQRMVRADLGGAGVMFSIDTETGFEKIVVIDASWGLGENVVQGMVDPDEYEVFKPLLEDPACVPIIEKKRGEKARKMIYAASSDQPTRNVPTSKAERAAFVLADDEILALARMACTIERHYGRPMDIEWAKDGITNELFIVQARPETVQSRRAASAVQTYRLEHAGRRLLSGVAVGEAIASGPVRVIESPREAQRFVDGAILVTHTTDPDWLPLMRRASAIVTDHGGRTSHAAIVSRELGLPAVVGTGNATDVLHDEQEVTVCCAQGSEGFIYEGQAAYTVEEIDFAGLPATRTQVMLNLGNPAAALRWWRLPADGVGLARMEFVIGNDVKIHPMALAHYDALADADARHAIDTLTAGYADRCDYFVQRLARGLARIAAVQHPHPVIVRMSDFKTNEYANLIGGAQFEPKEENPMLGFRGASRYDSPRYRDGFALECRAIDRLRRTLGFTNVIVMIPFCRSTKEADRVLAAMAEHGLRRAEDGLQVYVMCEIPSNVILAEAFAARFDRFSIGSNDLTQLTLGVDRDAAELAPLFDEEDDAVKWMIAHVIEAAHRAKAKVGLCGQAPSDRPAFASFLVAEGIDSVSVTPDSFVAVKRRIAEAEAASAAAAS
ncbi:phosphoenolpyruvate synthase [Trinickia caryophylli]|uniref:Phosphoenolpyruvate synthase n=1 Tax=Trinickia caryophylli TaxID=28094 RepID=A0A1X7DXH8_TRICW|nr:phosphoenolpyruvate synthase [Trinickia caryophylli]PMS14185.1 phosphoenolpyruvate synthase [Trinickia caryophylli]TRX17884.1 phosphoenolpyruvate synthase [Trinickia caryophylli]WQE11346.1 phosphoenolpyruvate synthase [Trinickia caryophylli]SMF23442.1 phosphoenolpyruvate synthase [Trinickia caryophylli]GLU32502.1 phosphoenolpyruvate synthase [Trinickia caryophylli]